MKFIFNRRDFLNTSFSFTSLNFSLGYPRLVFDVNDFDDFLNKSNGPIHIGRTLDPMIVLLNEIKTAADNLNSEENKFNSLLKNLLNFSSPLLDIYTKSGVGFYILWSATESLLTKLTSYFFDSYLCININSLTKFIDDSKPFNSSIINDNDEIDIVGIPNTLKIFKSDNDHLLNTIFIKKDISIQYGDSVSTYTISLNCIVSYENSIHISNLGYPLFYDSNDQLTLDPISNLPVSSRAEFRNKFIDQIHIMLRKYNYEPPNVGNSILSSNFSPYRARITGNEVYLLSKVIHDKYPKAFPIQNKLIDTYDMYLYFTTPILVNTFSSFISKQLVDGSNISSINIYTQNSNALCDLSIHFEGGGCLGLANCNEDINLKYELIILRPLDKFFYIDAQMIGWNYNVEASSPLGIANDDIIQQAESTTMSIINNNSSITFPYDLTSLNFSFIYSTFAYNGFLINIKY